MRIPAAACGPGFEGGGQVNALVSLLDFPPTLLDAAGIAVPPEMQGRSLLPLPRGEREGWPEEVFVQISESQVGRCVRTRRWKYSVVAPGRSGNEYPDADTYAEEFLYDLHADPWELTNLIGFESHQEVAGVMRERLVRRMVAAGEQAPAITAAPSCPSGQRRVTAAEARQ